MSDGLSNTVFLGERTSRLADCTWVGVVPYASVWPKPGWPSDPVYQMPSSALATSRQLIQIEHARRR